MAIGDNDLGVFFQDWNRAEREGGSAFGCVLEYPEQFDAPYGLKAPVVLAKPAIRYATSDAPGLKSGDRVKVDGVWYRVRESRLEGDGKVSIAELKSDAPGQA